MTRNWLRVIAAGLFEVGWVVGLKHSSSIGQWGVTLLAIILSFYLMISASKYLPVGTVYAVFVGIGTTGTIMLEALAFGHALTIPKIMLIGLLLSGVVGLKLVTSDVKEEEVL